MDRENIMKTILFSTLLIVSTLIQAQVVRDIELNTEFGSGQQVDGNKGVYSEGERADRVNNKLVGLKINFLKDGAISFSHLRVNSRDDDNVQGMSFFRQANTDLPKRSLYRTEIGVSIESPTIDFKRITPLDNSLHKLDIGFGAKPTGSMKWVDDDTFDIEVTGLNVYYFHDYGEQGDGNFTEVNIDHGDLRQHMFNVEGGKEKHFQINPYITGDVNYSLKATDLELDLTTSLGISPLSFHKYTRIFPAYAPADGREYVMSHGDYEAVGGEWLQYLEFQYDDSKFGSSEGIGISGKWRVAFKAKYKDRFIVRFVRDTEKGKSYNTQDWTFSDNSLSTKVSYVLGEKRNIKAGVNYNRVDKSIITPEINLKQNGNLFGAHVSIDF
jgi:hypothetical protein